MDREDEEEDADAEHEPLQAQVAGVRKSARTEQVDFKAREEER